MKSLGLSGCHRYFINALELYFHSLPFEQNLLLNSVFTGNLGGEFADTSRPLLHPRVRLKSKSAGGVVPSETDPNGARV